MTREEFGKMILKQADALFEAQIALQMQKEKLERSMTDCDIAIKAVEKAIEDVYKLHRESFGVIREE